VGLVSPSHSLIIIKLNYSINFSWGIPLPLFSPLSCLRPSLSTCSSYPTSHESVRWSTQGITMPMPTMRTTYHPHQLWSKSYWCKPKCFRLSNKWWPICIKAKVTNRHHNLILVTNLVNFRRPRHQHSHTRLSQWMMMAGLKRLKRNFKSCNAIAERWFCSPHTSSRALHSTSGMHMLMHMRSPAAWIGRNSGLHFIYITYPKALSRWRKNSKTWSMGLCLWASVTPTFYKNNFFVQIEVHLKMHIKL
jgi:hypothetical protein